MSHTANTHMLLMIISQVNLDQPPARYFLSQLVLNMYCTLCQYWSFTCAQKLTKGQLSLAHGTETKN